MTLLVFILRTKRKSELYGDVATIGFIISEESQSIIKGRREMK